MKVDVLLKKLNQIKHEKFTVLKNIVLLAVYDFIRNT